VLPERVALQTSALWLCALSLCFSTALGEVPLSGTGAVVAAHPLAARAGAEVLEEGGGAADAALCALMVLGVVEPQASGLGGGGFALIHGADGRAEVIDFRETAPAGLVLEVFFDPADSLGLARTHRGSAVAVPGTPMGLALLWERHGGLPLPRLLEPAIRLAEDGYPVSRMLAGLIQEQAETILGSPALSELFLVDGFPPAEGDTLYNPALGAVLRKLTERGLRAFYELEAPAVSEAVRAAGGWIGPEDLSSYRALIREPLRSTYRGLVLMGPPPPATGPVAVMECLNIIEALDPASLDEPARIHLLAEALKKALRDRGKRCGDPAFHASPLDSLLDKDLARRILERIHPDALHHNWPPLGSRPLWPPESDQGNTTHLCVSDGRGTVISLTQSINYFFGAGLPCNGYLLNNQMADFTFLEGSLNLPEPGKRPRSSMAPLILLEGDRPLLCLGTPGGQRIISATVQILVGHLDLGLPLQGAIEAPRFHPLGATLVMEPRFSESALAALDRIGYRSYPLKPMDLYFGGAHGIRFHHEGRIECGVDPRRDGAASLAP